MEVGKAIYKSAKESSGKANQNPQGRSQYHRGVGFLKLWGIHHVGDCPHGEGAE